MAIWEDLIPESDMKPFQRGGMGGISGFGKRPALLVVDMTYAFVDERYPLGSPTGPDAAKAIKRLLELARPKGVPIIYTAPTPFERAVDKGRWKTTDDPMMRSPEAYEIWPEIAPAPEDVVIVKGKPSAFFGTDLVSKLNFFDIDTTIITGMVTSGCVRATAVDAFSYNYYVIIPEECVADRSQISHKVSLFDIHMKYGDVLPLSQVEEYIRNLKQD